MCAVECFDWLWYYGYLRHEIFTKKLRKKERKKEKTEKKKQSKL
jgi:hypothetical protein